MFKNILDSDLDVFINLDEFGELATINGVDIVVIQDSDSVKEYKQQNLDLLYEDLVLIYCRVDDLDRINIDNYIEYNGMFYNIIVKDNQNGIYQIMLKRSIQGTIKEWF